MGGQCGGAGGLTGSHDWAAQRLPQLSHLGHGGWILDISTHIYTYLHISTGQTGLKLQVKGESQGGQTAAGRGGQQLGAAAAGGQLRRVRGGGARRGRGLRHGRQHLRGQVPAAAARMQTHPETR